MSSSFECDLYIMLAVIISAILFFNKKFNLFIFFGQKQISFQHKLF